MFRIKKLDIFIVKQFGLLFAGTFFICQFVLMMQFLWRYVDELIGKGLSIEVLAQFFWYMGLMLMPQAFPLALLLSSLITFGNLGESSELTAIKAAGISLMQAFRSLIVVTLLVAMGSYWFQNNISPQAFRSFSRLLISMKQKNPEVEIPEGIFYDGIPGSNLYVQRKNMETGALYGIMIYRRTGSYDDQAIILADSGMMQTTEDEKHLLLTLHSGEWFENMKSQDVGGMANVPYRRESFAHKMILLDFDSGLNMVEMDEIAGSARGKGTKQLRHDLDSIRVFNDSISRANLADARQWTYFRLPMSREDSLEAAKRMEQGLLPRPDSVYRQLNEEQQLGVTRRTLDRVINEQMNLNMKGDYSKWLEMQDREHQMEIIAKVTLALSCVIFFFIGAPLGAIIRKGGLGVPVIISVLVFIVYYIFENSGMRMARADEWTVWFGKWISTMVLAPLAVFFTYKANRDSAVFNIDAYKTFFMHLLGLRESRHVYRKEVIIYDPDYRQDARLLEDITEDIRRYHQEHQLLSWPNPVKVFFRPGDDQTIKAISEQLETVLEDLGNTRDKVVLHLINQYPVMATHAHTRPFRQRGLNIITGLVLPLGIFFYFRMLRFRFRLYRDLKIIEDTNAEMLKAIDQVVAKEQRSTHIN